MGPAELVYGGVKYKKVRHAVLCKICKETIESSDKYVHDYKVCTCGSVGIDNDRVIGSLEYGDVLILQFAGILIMVDVNYPELIKVLRKYIPFLPKIPLVEAK